MQREIKNVTTSSCYQFCRRMVSQYQKENRRELAGNPESVESGIREILEQIGHAVNADMVTCSA